MIDLKPRWYRINQSGINEYNSYDEFYNDMAPTWQPGAKLSRIDPYDAYKPGNCIWNYPGEPERSTRGRRKGTWVLHRNGQLVMLRILRTVPLSANAKATTPLYVAVCDCGRLCTVKGARFKRTWYCRHPQCPHHFHTDRRYKGPQPPTERLRLALSRTYDDPTDAPVVSPYTAATDRVTFA